MANVYYCASESTGTFVFSDGVGIEPLACRSTYDFQHDKEELYFGIRSTRSWVIDSSILAPTVSIKKSFFLLDFHFLRMFHFSTIVYFMAVVPFIVDCFFLNIVHDQKAMRTIAKHKAVKGWGLGWFRVGWELIRF